MKRRTYLKAAVGAALARPLLPAAVGSQQAIQLHVDLTVDAAREKEMLDNFHKVFKPAAAKQPGYIDVSVMKLRSTLAGAPPSGANYRFVLTYQNEALRQKWVSSATHQKVWPTIEKTLKHKNYNVLLYDLA